MAIEDIWLANLKALVAAEGRGSLRAGLRSVADNADLSEEYLYQLHEGKTKGNGKPRKVGKDAAAKIAKAFAQGRPLDWFDQPQGRQPRGDLLAPAASKVVRDLAQLLQQPLDPALKEAITRHLAALVIAPDSALLITALTAALSPTNATGGPAQVDPAHQDHVNLISQQAEERHAREQQQRRPVPGR